MVKNYLVNNLVQSHLYNYDYKEPSKTLGAYYAQFSELRLPAATDSESDSEEELQNYGRDSQHVEPFPLQLRLPRSTHQEPTTLW